ncbi:MAG TPA: CAP domain-containing protein [Anaeromyxobacter sp.]|nr:CAP domain-containing protein [Anaeromyxobacter sp.]
MALTPVEARAVDLARSRLGAGGARPRASGSLSLAARELARGAASGAAEPLSSARVRSALSRALAYDAAPVAVLVEAPAAGVLEALAAALPGSRPTHVGAGAAERGGSVVLVLLASQRRARLSPFPRDVAPGAAAPLSGSLAPGLARPRVFVTLPSGAVREAAARGGRDFTAALRFPDPGRYAVEVVADGDGGPLVAALFAVAAGGASLDEREEAIRPADPADDAAAEAAVIRAVNATRRRQGLAALAPAAELADVARRHSAAMAAQGAVAHVLPGSGELGGRLRQAGIPYARAYENVARAATALGAHETAEASPAHRGNLLRPDATRVGVGIARAALPSGDRAVYLTEVFVAPPDDGAESRLVPDARVREALWRERQRLGLAALSGDAALDDLARDAARRMHERDAPDADGLGERALALRRGLAAVDVFVASGPAEAIRSANLRDARFRRVGVGVTVGDSRRYGAGRFWIAVVYTD